MHCVGFGSDSYMLSVLDFINNKQWSSNIGAVIMANCNAVYKQCHVNIVDKKYGHSGSNSWTSTHSFLRREESFALLCVAFQFH